MTNEHTLSPLKVLSLFDGMACARIALERAGFDVSHYYASEVDKYAIKVAQENYPDITHIGGVCEVQPDNYPNIDLLIGGSPCQGFSFAGKQLNFDDPRSKLFWEYMRILKQCKPKYFLLENVRMKKEYQDIISKALGVEPIVINSSLVSAQNRVRYYWTNIPNVTQPEDKGILLKDILEDGVVARTKSHGLDANYFKGGNLKSYFEKRRRQLVFTGGRQVGRRLDENGTRKDYSDIPAKQRIEPRLDGKAGCLTTVQKDSILCDLVNYQWRKLTPLECERLQTVPDNYTASVSNTQRYKMLGNGFTVDVIAHILKNMEIN